MHARASIWLALALLPVAARAQTCTLVRASVDATGAEADGGSVLSAITPDGRLLVFASSATNLVAGDTNQRDDIFLRDLLSGSVERVSLPQGGGESNGTSSYPTISDDGRFVVFSSVATNLVPGDANAHIDVFVRDRLLGTTERVSVGAGGIEGNAPSFGGTVSADGRYVVFASLADNLVANDTNQQRDVFLRDRSTGVTERISVSGAGVEGDSTSGGGTLLSRASADGRFVAFASFASNLVAGDTNDKQDVFLRDRVLGTTERIVLGVGGAQPDGDTDVTAMTSDARFLALMSTASNLVSGDQNNLFDAFVLDRSTGAVDRVSVSSSGAEGDGASLATVVSHDGRYALFTSVATNLVPGDLNEKRDVFRRDRWAGTTQILSLGTAGAQTDADCYGLTVAASGERVVYASAATGLVPGDSNGASDVFVLTCLPGTVFCTGDGTGAACPCGNAGAWDAGCANSVSTGAALAAEGVARTSADTLTLVVRGVPPGAPTLFFQGTTPLGGVAFGDGLRCIGGTITRLGTVPAAGGSAAWGFGVSGSPLLSVQGNVPAGGDFRYYQAWYRNAAEFCLPLTFNLSNGFEVVWGP